MKAGVALLVAITACGGGRTAHVGSPPALRTTGAPRATTAASQPASMSVEATAATTKVVPCFEVTKVVEERSTTATGTIAGRVTEKEGGAGIAGVTVVATSPVLRGTMAEITDDSGQYLITNLPYGVYAVTFYYSESKIERTSIEVRPGRRPVLDQRIDTGQASAGETVTINLGGCAELHTRCPGPDKDDIQSVAAVPCP